MAVHRRQPQRRVKKNSHVEGGYRFRTDRGELMCAMESLYVDQLKPTSRTLRRRIGERASGLTAERLYGAADGEFKHLPDIDLDHLQSLCRDCSCIQVQMDEVGDWSAMFNDRPHFFVDVYNPTDPFSDEFWEIASKYFEGLSGSDAFLPRTRYACAQALVGRKLEFLSSYTLGQVCHMVEIAISRRKLLGYYGDAIVPYSYSLSMRKVQCAEQQRRCTPVDVCTIDVGVGCQASPMLPPATLEVARRYLREILQANTVVPLSNIKRIFRMHYQTELSETLLGHSRLSDLLQDIRFRDLCTVQLQQNGYAVIAQHGLQETQMRAVGQGFECTAEETPRVEPAALLPTRVPSPVAVLSTPLQSPGLPTSARVRMWSTCHGNFQKEAATSHHQQLQLGPERHLASSISRKPQSRSQYCRDECYDLSFEPAGGEPAVDVGPVTMSLSSATPLPSPGSPTNTMRRGWSDKARCTRFCKDEPLCLVPTPLAHAGVPGSVATHRWADLSQKSSSARSGSSDSTVSGDTLVSTVSFPWEASGISTAQGLPAAPIDNGQNASEDSLQLPDGCTQLLRATECSASFAESGEQPDKEQGPMVSPKVSFELQPTSLSAQADRLGLTIQNTVVLLAPSSNREKRSSSSPPKMSCTAASGQAWPLTLVSSVGRMPPRYGCEATAHAEEEGVMAVKDHVTTAFTICDDGTATKADAVAPRSPQRRMVRRVRSAKLLELMPPCCRTLFHSATVPESTLRAA